MEHKDLTKYSQPVRRIEAPVGLPPAALKGAQSQRSPINNLRDVLTILFKHKNKILLVFLAGLCASPILYFIFTTLRPPIYQASSLLMLRSGRDYSSPDLNTGKDALGFGRSQIFNTEVSLLQNRQFQEKIISDFSVGTLYPDIEKNPPKSMSKKDAALLEFNKDLAAGEVRNTNFIRVSFQHKNPEIAARVVNSLVDLYLTRRLEFLSDPKSTFFLEKKVAEYRQKVKESEERLEAFRKQYAFFSFEKQMELLMTRRTTLQSSIQEAQTQIETLKQTLVMLDRQVKTMPDISMPAYSFTDESTISGRTGSTGLEAKLLDLQLKEQQLLGKYTEQNLYVVNIRKEIGFVKNLIKKEQEAVPSVDEESAPTEDFFQQSMEQQKTATKSNLKSLEANIADYRKELKDLDKQIQNLGSQEKKLRELQRDLNRNEKYNEIYSNKVEEARIADDINRQDMASVTVLQQAVTPVKPSQPTQRAFVFPVRRRDSRPWRRLGSGFHLGILGSGFFHSGKRRTSLGNPRAGYCTV